MESENKENTGKQTQEISKNSISKEFLLVVDIQKWWEVPCIAQFISLFGAEFCIPQVDIEVRGKKPVAATLILKYLQCLERILLNRGTDEVSGFTIHDIVVPLLRGIYKAQRSEILSDCYGKMLRRFIRKKCLPISMDLGDDFDIYTELVDLPVRNQVLLLHSLCYLRLEPELENCEVLFRSECADSYRAAPLGEDSKRNSYWYFSGLRLYKDEFISENERLWSVVCFNEEDWVRLSSKLETSRNANEKALYANLQEMLPAIHNITVKKLKIERINSRYTVSGGEINSGNLISSRTRSTRRNSIK